MLKGIVLFLLILNAWAKASDNSICTDLHKIGCGQELLDDGTGIVFNSTDEALTDEQINSAVNRFFYENSLQLRNLAPRHPDLKCNKSPAVSSRACDLSIKQYMKNLL